MTSRQPPRVTRSGADSRLPLYEQVKASLLEDIRAGALREGDRLPPEAQLCAAFDVSRTVIRQATGELEQEGYLERLQGRGTFVRTPKLTEYFLDSAD
jgi:GntR family transcriptional regulator